MGTSLSEGKESRLPRGGLRSLVFVLSLTLVLFQLRGGLLGPFPALIQGAIHVGFVMALCFICYPAPTGSLWALPHGNDLLLFVLGGASGILLVAMASVTIGGMVGSSYVIPALAWCAIGVGVAVALYLPTKRPKGRRTILPVDAVLGILAAIATAYTVVNYDRLTSFAASATSLDYLMSAALLLLVFEAGRRVIGWVMLLLMVALVAYTLLGQYIPGHWGHGPFSVQTLLYTLYMTDAGFFGQITAISASLVALFIIYGGLLEVSGSGKSFINIALSIAGKSKGGPAKVAVVASSLFGTISGSAVANAAVIGNFTIPLMKNVGYSPEFAAGVEATASTGGQIMPPIMGVAAFIMAQLLGVSYLRIAMAALIPALAYYAAIFFTVHFLACRGNLAPVPPHLMPKNLRETLDWQMLVPLVGSIVVLLVLLASNSTLARSIFWSLVVLIILYLVLGGQPGKVPSRGVNVLRGLESGGRGIIMIATIVVLAQCVVSLIGMTGIGVKLAAALSNLGGSSLFGALVMSGAVCLILGAGMPTPAAYLVAVGVLLPGLTGAGLPPLVVHMFLFYYAVIANITPPVAPAVFVTCSMAGCSWQKTTRWALQMAYVGLIVPLIFAFRPGLLLIGTPLDILWSTLVVFLAVIAMAAGVAGFLTRRLSVIERMVFVAASALLFFPSLAADVIGVVIMVGAYMWQRFHKREFALSQLVGMGNRRN